MQLYKELESRGLIAQLTDKEIPKILETQIIGVYCGFDPTANSLHLGHLLPLLILRRFQQAGHRVVCVIGGATGLIGDPSGRNSERQMQSKERTKSNADGLKRQVARFLDFEGTNPAILLDNLQWFEKISIVEWLRLVGKHFRISEMLNKKSVELRMDQELGISYTEFSYQTLQSYDFTYLAREHDVLMQIGGSDQYGNICAGIELTRKMSGKKVYGITNPLMTTSTGEKFGKSLGNAIWLDSAKLNPFKFFQYWVQRDDSDVEKFLKSFTFMSIDEINELIRKHNESPENRLAQNRLAIEMTKIVHGSSGLDRAIKATKALFGGDLSEFADDELLEIFNDVPSYTLNINELVDENSIINWLVKLNIFISKSECKRFIKGGGLYINSLRVTDGNSVLYNTFLDTKKVLIIRKGKKQYYLLKISEGGGYIYA